METRRKKRSVLYAGISVILLCGALLIGMYLYRSRGTAVSAVPSVAVARGDLTFSAVVSGTTECGSIEQSIGFSLPTRSRIVLQVESVLAAKGDTVASGDPIYKLTQESVDNVLANLTKADSDAKIAYEAAQAEYETGSLTAKYDYKTNKYLKATAKKECDETIAELDDAVTKAKEALDAGVGDPAALQLSYSQAVSDRKTKAVEAEAVYQEALIRYASADDLYDIAVDQLTTSLKRAKAAYEAAEENLNTFQEEAGDGYIKAACSGKITALNYAAGNMVTARMALATYDDTSDITLTVPVDQSYVSSIEVGTDVSVFFSSGGTLTGKIAEVGTSSSSTRVSNVTYDVLLTFDDSGSKLTSGLTGKVSFTRANLQDVLYLPVTAVYENLMGKYVKLLNDDGTASEVSVVTGDSDGSYVVILEGVEEGALCASKS